MKNDKIDKIDKYSEWLKSLKIGSRVEYSGEILKITGETEHLWKTGSYNFWKIDGKIIGCGWGSEYVYELTAEAEKKIKEKMMKNYVLSFHYYKLDDIETFKKIFLILRDWEKRQETKNEKP